MTTRRRLLSLAVAGGLASAAGCSTSVFDDDPEYDESAIRDVPADDGLRLDERLPAGVGSDRFESNLTRARELLEQVPRSVTADEIPNEAVRQRVASRRETAAGTLEWATEVDASLEGLKRGRRARNDAAEAEAMYAAIVDDRSLDDELDGIDSTREDLDAMEAAYGYEGDDPVATLVTVGVVERYLSIASRLLESPTGPGGETGFEETAEAAGRIEKATAYVGDARHVDERFAAIWEEPRDFEETFGRALESLGQDLDERCSEYDEDDYATPSSLVDASIDDTPAEGVLTDLLVPTAGDCTRLDEGGDDLLARQLLSFHETAHRFEALSEARRRIEDGAYRPPADVAELNDLRARAIDALETAVAREEYSRLIERRLAPLTDRIIEADERRRTNPSAGTVRRATREYGYVEVMAATAVQANQWLVDGLRAAKR